MIKTVLLDVDGTLMASSEHVINMRRKELGLPTIKVENEKLEWNFQPYREDDDIKEYLKLFETKEFYKTVPPIEPHKVDEFIRFCHQHNIKVYACSKRSQKFCEPLLEWFNVNLKALDGWIFISAFEMKEGIYPDAILIDDKPECLSGNRKHNILFGDYGYQYVEGTINIPESVPYKRAKNWSEVISVVSDIISSEH